MKIWGTERVRVRIWVIKRIIIFRRKYFFLLQSWRIYKLLFLILKANFQVSFVRPTTPLPRLLFDTNFEPPVRHPVSRGTQMAKKYDNFSITIFFSESNAFFSALQINKISTIYRLIFNTLYCYVLHRRACAACAKFISWVWSSLTKTRNLRNMKLLTHFAGTSLKCVQMKTAHFACASVGPEQKPLIWNKTFL